MSNGEYDMPEMDLRQYYQWQVADHPPVDACTEDDCVICSMRDCPEGCELHYHHDGCPYCASAKIDFKDETDNRGVAGAAKPAPHATTPWDTVDLSDSTHPIDNDAVVGFMSDSLRNDDDLQKRVCDLAMAAETPESRLSRKNALLVLKRAEEKGFLRQGVYDYVLKKNGGIPG
jgi:hypothetical protein